MNDAINLEHRASSSQGKHEGESSLGLCDRLDRTRDNSQRQLPTDHDYAVSTREYQTDQSSLKTAPAAARSVFGKQQKQRQKQTCRFGDIDTVTPYQAFPLTISNWEQVVSSVSGDNAATPVRGSALSSFQLPPRFLGRCAAGYGGDRSQSRLQPAPARSVASRSSVRPAPRPAPDRPGKIQI